jgi:hypothetical protein
MMDTLSAVSERFADYLTTTISTEISEQDDMYAMGDLEHYLEVGHSAIEVIARSMILASKVDIQTILDLPCGGGRVTRHLSAFFPHAKLFAGISTSKKNDCRKVSCDAH